MNKYFIEFQIHFSCNPGEFLIVLGNIQELGKWNADCGLLLHWNQVI